MNRQTKFWLMLSILLVIAMIVIAIGNARAQTFNIISDCSGINFADTALLLLIIMFVFASIYIVISYRKSK